AAAGRHRREGRGPCGVRGEPERRARVGATSLLWSLRLGGSARGHGGIHRKTHAAVDRPLGWEGQAESRAGRLDPAWRSGQGMDDEGRGLGDPGARPRSPESTDYGRTYDDDQSGALRDAAPSILEPIAANAPVSGHRPGL